VDGGNLPVGVIERRDFTLSLTDDETLRKPRLPFWHIDYFTQPQLDDPDFFLVPDWPLPDHLGPPVDVLGPRDTAAVIVRPERLCPSPPPEMDETATDVVHDEQASHVSVSTSSQSQSQQHSDNDKQSTSVAAESETDNVVASHSTINSPSDIIQ